MKIIFAPPYCKKTHIPQRGKHNNIRLHLTEIITNSTRFRDFYDIRRQIHDFRRKIRDFRRVLRYFFTISDAKFMIFDAKSGYSMRFSLFVPVKVLSLVLNIVLLLIIISNY